MRLEKKTVSKRKTLALSIIAFAGLLCAAGAFACRLKYPAHSQTMPNPVEQLAAKEADEEFDVVVFSDIANNYKTMKLELEAVNATNADFAICNGDLVKYGSSAIRFSYVQRQLLKTIKMPLFIIPGNHDDTPEVGFQRYHDFFGPERQYWNYADTLFVSINTGKKSFDEIESRFLKATLEQERAKFRRCVLIMHCPPVDLRPNQKSHCLEDENQIKALEDLVKEHHIDMIVTSHIHWYLEGTFAGAHIFHTPSGGQHVRDPENPNFGYVLMSFKKDGGILLKHMDVASERGRGAEYCFIVISERFPKIACTGLTVFVAVSAIVFLSKRKTKMSQDVK